MGLLNNIVIITLLSLPVVASFLLMHRGKVSLAIGVLGVGFLVGHQVLQHVAFADLYRYHSTAGADGTDFLGRTVLKPTWGYLSDAALDTVAYIGFGLLALAALGLVFKVSKPYVVRFVRFTWRQIMRFVRFAAARVVRHEIAADVRTAQKVSPTLPQDASLKGHATVQ